MYQHLLDLRAGVRSWVLAALCLWVVGGLQVLPVHAQIVSAVLPNARTTTVVSGERSYLTVFMTVINGGGAPLTGCYAALPGDSSVGLDYQTTDPATNALTGTLNTPFNLAPGAAQSLLLSFRASRSVRVLAAPVVACDGGAVTPTMDGLTTVDLNFSSSPQADIIPIALALPDLDGVVRLASSDGVGLMVTAAVNIGAESTLRVRPVGRMRAASGFEAGLLICETDPSGTCVSSPEPWLSVTFARDVPRTFNVYVLGADTLAGVPFDPAGNRVRLEFSTSNGTLVGLTSAAASVPENPAPNVRWIEAARLLTQATFGGEHAEQRALLEADPAVWLDAQLAQPLGETHWDYVTRRGPPGCSVCESTGRNAFMESFWRQADLAPDQLRRRFAFALSQILVIDDSEGEFAVASYLDMLERHAFGNYRDLLRDVSLHPAMGKYLSHMANQKADPVTGRVPDENFAREAMQLFSIGLWELNLDGSRRLDQSGQPIPTYDQDDILNMARVFTGMSWGGADTSQARWNGFQINGVSSQRWDLPMQFYERYHAPEAKVILKRLTIPAGTPGPETLEQAIDVLFNHPNVGPFIGEQLIQRLVTSNPSRGYVERVARAFNDNGSGVRGDMKSVLRAILLDPEARTIPPNVDAAGKLREPVMRFSQWLRAYGGLAASGLHRITGLENTTTALGQAPFKSPSVFNFYRPDYQPPGAIAAAGLRAPEFQITHETSVTGYANFMFSTINSGYGSGSNKIFGQYGVELGLAHTPRLLVDYVARRLGIAYLAPQTREDVLSMVESYSMFDTSGPQRRVVAAILGLMQSPDYLIER